MYTLKLRCINSMRVTMNRFQIEDLFFSKHIHFLNSGWSVLVFSTGQVVPERQSL